MKNKDVTDFYNGAYIEIETSKGIMRDALLSRDDEKKERESLDK